MEVWNGVCGAIGVDDLTFKYALVPPGADAVSEPKHGGARGFAIQMGRQLGRGEYKVALDNKGLDAPVRIVQEYAWPPAVQNVCEDFDAAAEAIFTSLGTGWQRVLAEARIKGQVDAASSDGVGYLVDHVLRLNRSSLESLEAPPEFASVRIHTPAGEVGDDDQLAQPRREGNIEVLKEDRRSLYVELMSQWPQLSIAPTGGVVSVDASRIRRFTDPPSAYIMNGMGYIESKLLPLFLTDLEDTSS